MSKFKKLISVALALLLLGGIVTPAYAGSADWSGFGQVYQGACNHMHAVAVQRAIWFLHLTSMNAYQEEPANILDANGGIDGMFGNGTTAAVKEFQKVFSLSVDGKVGPQTWPKLKSKCLQACHGGALSGGYYYWGYENSDGLEGFRQYGVNGHTGYWQVEDTDGVYRTFEN